MTEPPPGPALRTRYLDWCSAQIVRRIQSMPAEAVWRAVYEPTPPRRGSLEVVRRLTAALSRELPSLEQWLEIYRADPASVERDLAGFAPADPTDPATAPAEAEAPDPPVWRLFFATWAELLPAGSRGAPPRPDAPSLSPALRAEGRARERAWVQLRRVHGWSPEQSRALLDALTTELRLWRFADGHDLEALRAALERTEERFLATSFRGEAGVPFPVRLPDPLYLPRPDDPAIRDVVPWPGATAYITDGWRYGVRLEGGESLWFSESTPLPDSADPPAYPEHHPLYRRLHEVVQQFGRLPARG